MNGAKAMNPYDLAMKNLLRYVSDMLDSFNTFEAFAEKYNIKYEPVNPRYMLREIISQIEREGREAYNTEKLKR